MSSAALVTRNLRRSSGRALWNLMRRGGAPVESAAHVRYETLHPYTDGNGRSGRAVWLWHMTLLGQQRGALAIGFLHNFTIRLWPRTTEGANIEGATMGNHHLRENIDEHSVLRLWLSCTRHHRGEGISKL